MKLPVCLCMYNLFRIIRYNSCIGIIGLVLVVYDMLLNGYIGKCHDKCFMLLIPSFYYLLAKTLDTAKF